MDIISTGTDYKELPDTYVIFICDFDPFGFGKYKYTFDMICTETGEMGERYMLLKELLSDERAEGRNEGRTEGIAIGRVRGKAEFVIELLSELGEVSTELSDAIMAEKDPARLLAYLKAASKADSVEKFRKETGL